jgi:hypothetical protein
MDRSGTGTRIGTECLELWLHVPVLGHEHKTTRIRPNSGLILALHIRLEKVTVSALTHISGSFEDKLQKISADKKGDLLQR